MKSRHTWTTLTGSSSLRGLCCWYWNRAWGCNTLPRPLTSFFHGSMEHVPKHWRLERGKRHWRLETSQWDWRIWSSHNVCLVSDHIRKNQPNLFKLKCSEDRSCHENFPNVFIPERGLGPTSKRSIEDFREKPRNLGFASLHWDCSPFSECLFHFVANIFNRCYTNLWHNNADGQYWPFESIERCLSSWKIRGFAHISQQSNPSMPARCSPLARGAPRLRHEKPPSHGVGQDIPLPDARETQKRFGKRAQAWILVDVTTWQKKRISP